MHSGTTMLLRTPGTRVPGCPLGSSTKNMTTKQVLISEEFIHFLHVLNNVRYSSSSSLPIPTTLGIQMQHCPQQKACECHISGHLEVPKKKIELDSSPSHGRAWVNVNSPLGAHFCCYWFLVCTLGITQIQRCVSVYVHT